MKDIIKTMNGWMQPVKEFMIKQSNNPIFWLLLLGLGLLVFKVVFDALQKEK